MAWLAPLTDTPVHTAGLLLGLITSVYYLSAGVEKTRQADGAGPTGGSRFPNQGGTRTLCRGVLSSGCISVLPTPPHLLSDRHSQLPALSVKATGLDPRVSGSP